MLIRHGQTKSNAEHRYLGRTDEPLSEQGKQDLMEKKKKGNYPIPEKVFVSPMRRCIQTAEILFPDSEVVCIPEWVEIEFGTFEGKNYEELKEEKEYQAWIDSGGRLPFPNGESREAFQERVMAGYKKITDASNTDVVAVVHGGTIMALCSSLLGGEYFDYQIKCGEQYECRVKY